MKKTLKCALVCVFAVALEFVLHSEPNDPAGKILPTQLEGKITGWTKTNNVLTVDIKGTSLNINVTPQVKITRKGKSATSDQLASGKPIKLQFMELPSGKLEVASLFVEPVDERVEASPDPDLGVPLGR